MAIGLVRRLRQRLAVLAIRAIQRWGPQRVRVRGKTYRVEPSVFNPKYVGTSRFMAKHIEAAPDDVVLDMGTGCGIQAIVAAQTAQRVVAADINPAAVRCTRENVAAHGLDDRVTVVQSDLFAGLDPAESFTLILFTPPYLEGTPRTPLDHALLNPQKAILDRFFRNAGSFLAPGGRIHVLYSSIADTSSALIAVAERHGWQAALVASRRFLGERLTVHRFTRGRE
ncbi:MAG: HemK2/MTQ2 family protein methyltransferase [Planctomycetota bacterium]